MSLSRAVLGLGLLLVSIAGIPLAADLSSDLSVTGVENLAYKTTAKPRPDIASIHGAIGSDVSLLEAYKIGSDAIKHTKEPILTRGAKGIALYRAASPAVVLVVVGSVVNGEFQESGLGTGVAVDSRGYILTNWHVINGFDKAVVFLKPATTSSLDNAAFFIGSVVWANVAKDLALLKLDKAPQTLPTIPVGSMGEIEVAEDVHIIGHPHGEYWSYSTGVISQVRDNYGWKYEDGSQHRAKVLQLQTAINPGNSGGPVLNDAGHLIGLVAMSEEGQNLDYAIAADEIQAFLLPRIPVRTRGIVPAAQKSAEPVVPTLEVATASLPDGLTVARSQVHGFTVYVISDSHSRPFKAFVRISPSSVVTIQGWDEHGYFREYRLSTTGGKQLFAKRGEDGLHAPVEQ